jgi:hypothetical protein
MSTCESPFTATFNLTWNGSGYLGSFSSQIPQGKAVRVIVFLTSAFIGVSSSATTFVKIGGVVVDQFQGSGPSGPYYIRSTDTFTVFTIGIPSGLGLTAGLYGDLVPENTEIVFPQVRSVTSVSTYSSAPSVSGWMFSNQYPNGNVGVGLNFPGGSSGTTYQANQFPATEESTGTLTINGVAGAPSQNQPYYIHAVSVGGSYAGSTYPLPVNVFIQLNPVEGLGLSTILINCGLGWTPIGMVINTAAIANVYAIPAQTFTVAANQVVAVNVILYTSPIMILS